MVTEATEEGLIDCTPEECVSKGITSEHINHGIRLVFAPECILMSDSNRESVWSRLAWIGDGAIRNREIGPIAIARSDRA